LLPKEAIILGLTVITAIIAAAAAISGIILGWTGRNRAVKQVDRQEAGANAVLRSDMDYIKRGVDDIRLEQRAQRENHEKLAERVTRVEESTKQAHHRINRLDGTREE
jgi:hypothetical protein